MVYDFRETFGSNSSQKMDTRNTANPLNPPAVIQKFRLARRAWYPVAGIALAIFLASLPGYLVLIPRGFDLNGSSITESSPFIFSLYILSGIFSIITAFLSLYLAFVLFRRRPDDFMALFLSYFLLAFGVLAGGPLEALLIFLPEIARQFSQAASVLITLPMAIFLFALFPDGRFVPAWTRWLGILSFLVVLLMATLSTIGYGLMFVLLFVMLYAQIYRYKHVSNQEQKQQTKWFVYGLGVLIALLVIVSIPRTWSPVLNQSLSNPLWEAGSMLIYNLSFSIIPVTLTVSVMRYRLYDIDVLINRTLVYGLLTALTMGIYVFAVGYLGSIFQAQTRNFIAFLTTGLVALLFQPMRDYLQRLVNRLMYGERDDPMSVLLKMGQQLEGAILDVEDLNGIVETVAQALRLPYVAIAITNNDRREIAASYGFSSNETLEIPLIYQAEKVGHLVIAQRGNNENFSSHERILLENIASQASAAVYSVRLTADLQQSRQRLVRAREEERRRLRRDLHDGLGASLAALHLQTGAIRRAIDTNPEQAKSMLEEFKAELHEAIADIRRVAYELRPPALDELGLPAALKALASRYNKSEGHEEGVIPDQLDELNLDIQMDVPENLPPLQAAVEVAVYRIVQEALTNVVNHSEAKNCRVSLMIGDDFQLEIFDDGIGISPDQPWGIGLSSMCERATELGGVCSVRPARGGGTRVLARFPLLYEQRG